MSVEGSRFLALLVDFAGIFETAADDSCTIGKERKKIIREMYDEYFGVARGTNA